MVFKTPQNDIQMSLAIAEAESSCVVFGMPSELIQRGGASVVLPSQDVARQLRTWVQRLG